MGTSMHLLLQGTFMEPVPTQLFVLFIESQEQKPLALDPDHDMLPGPCHSSSLELNYQSSRYGHWGHSHTVFCWPWKDACTDRLEFRGFSARTPEPYAL